MVLVKGDIKAFWMCCFGDVMSQKDTLFSDTAAIEPGSFRFNESVVRVFPDMIERSVPGYRALLDLTPLLVQQAVQPHTTVYDLGCSLGAATLAARRAIHVPGVNIVGLDSSPDMVDRCRTVIEGDNSTVPVTIEQADITQYNYTNASMMLMYFTLQFIQVGDRPKLLQRIYDGLNPGGVFVLAEKLAFDHPETQRWMDNHHQDFKRAQGYSDLEIAKKRQAIENVLVPATADTHLSLLKEVGFQEAHRWFQCLNFASFVAIK